MSTDGTGTGQDIQGPGRRCIANWRTERDASISCCEGNRSLSVAFNNTIPLIQIPLTSKFF
jgi:hypothetical protein